jgi:hypothetical protein
VLWPEGKQHNITSVTLIVQAIKGHGNETYEELKEFFESLGLSVAKGSLIADATNLL